ncbi:MAG: chromosomal replication initiator protein DnaA [Lachnospiraceae bacterium]|nr:chromosomal replication initiator protein DnaA [Lachnospiraceae bacterium]
MNLVKEKWDEIIHKLKIEYDILDVSFKTWIVPLEVCDVKEDIIFIKVPLKAYIDIITKKYLLSLKVCIAEVIGQEYDIQLVAAEDFIEESVSESSYNNKVNKNDIFEQANLNPKYTFDTFVVGKNNNFAHAASLAVAESPGEIYNPLFLYGGVGLGKTHLMHSIAHFILERDPSKKILYVTSETFTNELIDALKSGKTSGGNESAMTSFRDKYRNIDVLLVDDIQFIIGKESTQEEFFHTFNHLHGLGKHIIISSDKPPKDIETLEARLRTRFEWGLIADISSPDYETRMAILRKKEDLDGLQRYHIPNEVMQYIATNVKSNIRELEGSLTKLIALHKLKNEDINITLAAEALKDIISPNESRQITPELIIDIVSEHYSISIQDLKSGKRNSNVAIPRQIAMYLCREMTDVPLKAIGSILGGRDHSTISHGIEKVADEIKTDEALSNTIDIIKKKINPV